MLTFEDIQKVILSPDIPTQSVFVKKYCVSKGKDEKLTNVFIGALLQYNQLSEITRVIVDKESKRLNLVFLYNKNNQLINVYGSSKTGNSKEVNTSV